MTILYKRALLLAKEEDQFRTDSMPLSDIASYTYAALDATADVDDAAETITITGHGLTIGSIPGPFQATLNSGAFPTGIAASTDYWLSVLDANTVAIHTSAANAIADTRIDLTDAVGTFTLTPVNSDAILVSDPVFSADASILDRDNVKVHLSNDPGVAGRKLGQISFTHEVRNNGQPTDGSGFITEPKLGRLLRACAMSGTEISTGAANLTETIVDDAGIPVNSPTGVWTMTKTTAYTGTLPRVLELECTGAGAADGTALVSVYSPAVGNQPAINLAAAAFGGGAFDLTATESAQITPADGGTDLAVGDRWILNLIPEGWVYEPVSDNFTSLTFYLYYDGLLHKMPGARGTFTVEGEAANFATFNFTFTGDFVLPIDAAMPTSPTYEATVPPQVELANLVAAGGEDDVDFDLCAQSFSVDIGNEVVPRDCINETESLGGAIITGRSPTAAFNPEMELEATHPFWSNLDQAARVSWSLRVGAEQGNVVTFWAPYAQYSSLPYTDRNGIRAYDITMRLNTDIDAGGSGNDELRISFT